MRRKVKLSVKDKLCVKRTYCFNELVVRMFMVPQHIQKETFIFGKHRYIFGICLGLKFCPNKHIYTWHPAFPGTSIYSRKYRDISNSSAYFAFFTDLTVRIGYTKLTASRPSLDEDVGNCLIMTTTINGLLMD